MSGIRLTRLEWGLAALATVAVLGTVALLLLPLHASPRAGIPCDSMEGNAVHFHVQLQLWRDGKPVPLPADLGREGDCVFWVHCHTADGVVHVEAPVYRIFTLGDVFAIWGIEPPEGSKLWIKQEGEARFRAVNTPWPSVILKPHQVLALGTGAFSPVDFSFPSGL